MKKLIPRILALGLFCFLSKEINAQQTIPAGGSNASGSGGSVSYTIGQTFYTTNSGSPNGAAEQGVQIVDLGSNPLPIKLISFNGACMNGKIQLDWVTGSEENNEVFNVEQSDDAINWSILAKVNGEGTSTTTSEYTYTDPKPNAKATFYRLQQIDFNGEVTYSNTINVMNCESIQSSIVIYPNPTSDGVFISLEDFTGTTYQLSDIKGSLLGSGPFSSQQTFIPMAQLAAATYVIKVNRNNILIKTFKISKR